MRHFFLIAISVFFIVQANAQVNVPVVKKLAVVADGLFAAGEWSSAKKKKIDGDLTIYFLSDADVVAIGIFTTNPSTHYTDLYIQTTDIKNLHASMQLGERILPLNKEWNDEKPDWQWGNNKNWKANVVQYAPNASEDLPFVKQIKPYYGQEFVIEKSKVTDTFKLMILIRDFAVAEKKAMFPLKADVYDTNSWAQIN